MRSENLEDVAMLALKREEWVAEQGEPMLIEGRWIHPTGAYCPNSLGHPSPSMTCLPNEESELHEMRRLYAAERVERLRGDFTKQKDYLARIAREAAARPFEVQVPDDALRQLKATQKEHGRWAKILAEIEGRIKSAPRKREADRERRGLDVLRHQMSLENQSIHEEIEAMEL